MSEIRKTTDYSIFKKHESNDRLEQGNLHKVLSSIKAHNMLEYRPIMCDAEMRVIDGNHRLEAAKILGVPVFYQIQERATHEDIVLLQIAKPWGSEQYLNYYVSRGNEEYRKLKEYCIQKNIGVGEYLGLRKRGLSTTKSGGFKEGKFKFPPNEVIEQLDKALEAYAQIQETLKQYLLTDEMIITAVKAKAALIALINNEEFFLPTFIKKLIMKIDAVHRCADKMGYYVMFRDIYNYKNPNKIDI